MPPGVESVSIREQLASGWERKISDLRPSVRARAEALMGEISAGLSGVGASSITDFLRQLGESQSISCDHESVYERIGRLATILETGTASTDWTNMEVTHCFTLPSRVVTLAGTLPDGRVVMELEDELGSDDDSYVALFDLQNGETQPLHKTDKGAYRDVLGVTPDSRIVTVYSGQGKGAGEVVLVDAEDTVRSRIWMHDADSEVMYSREANQIVLHAITDPRAELYDVDEIFYHPIVVSTVEPIVSVCVGITPEGLMVIDREFSVDYTNPRRGRVLYSHSKDSAWEYQVPTMLRDGALVAPYPEALFYWNPKTMVKKLIPLDVHLALGPYPLFVETHPQDPRYIAVMDNTNPDSHCIVYFIDCEAGRLVGEIPLPFGDNAHQMTTTDSGELLVARKRDLFVLGEKGGGV